MSTFTPSNYQTAIFTWVQDGAGHALVDAAAGAGKSTTLVQASALLPKRTKALFCAFNRHIAKELAEKLKEVGASMECRTIHGLGRGALVAGLKRGTYAQSLADPDGRKYMRLADEYVLTTVKQEYEAQRVAWLKDHPPLGDWKQEILAGALRDPESQRLDAGLDEEDEEQFPEFDAYQLSGYVRKLVDFRRLTLTDPTEDALQAIADHYDLGIEFETAMEMRLFWPMLARGVEQVVKAGAEEYTHLGKIDYTDMVFLPVYLDLPPAKYDFLFVDEAQDLNACQLELVMRARKSGARMLFCADRHQSLYGFTGADTRSVDTIVERCQAVVLPLSICYRCPTSHIDLARQVYASIEASPTASLGIVSVIESGRTNHATRPGDYIICRTNAPLVSRCMALIRAGTKAVVLGKDLGKNFIDLLKKLSKRRGFSWRDLVIVAEEYQREQEEILSEQKDNDLALEMVRDKVATLKALRQAYLSELGEEGPKAGNLKGFLDFIEAFFAPEEDENGKRLDYSAFVVLCTVHKAKGLEANRIFVERSDLLPHPAAKKAWQVEQEHNILYVALTRAKRELYFIDQSPKSVELSATEEGPVTLVAIHDELHSVEEQAEISAGGATVYDAVGFEDYDPAVVSALFWDELKEQQAERGLAVIASVSIGGEAAKPLDSQTVEAVIIEESSVVEPLIEGKVSRIAAIEVLCPACNGVCVDPASGSTYITPDLIGHSVICSRCKQSCIVPLNAFSLEGAVVAREKPTGVTTQREKVGRKKKERKSNAGRKAKSGVVREPMQLSLDVRTIRALNSMGINKSQLFEELLQQYEPFIDAYAATNDDEVDGDEEDEDE